MFDVSIIMPIYNVEAHLERAIESALNQTKQDCEIILVNDGSTDGSAEICERYARKEPLLVQVIHQENQGAGPARNKGLEYAKGKYVYFADPDDYFKPTLIQHNVQEAEEKNADVVIFGYTEEKAGEPENREERLPNLPQMNGKEEFRRHFRNVYLFSPYALWNKLYRREFLIANAIHFTDQKLGQDALFNLDVFQELGRVAINRQAYYHYVTHEGSAVNRYRPDRFALEFNIAKRFEELMQSWKKEEEFKDLVKKEFWHPVYLELANVTHPDCPMSQKEKIEWIDWIMQHETIFSYMSEFSTKEESNLYRKWLIRSLQTGQVNRAIQLMHIRNNVAKNYAELFAKAKALLTSKRNK